LSLQKPAKAGFCVSGVQKIKATHPTRKLMEPVAAALARPHPNRKAHLRNNIVYHCFKFLQCDREEPCE
ncbi:hypothetical protein, partial [Pseudomonas mandelii]|uniref:hypothetical protein n=1 Tax=Pseudomonas mandelii TaxID=75612 RepID=UPI001C3CA0AC